MARSSSITCDVCGKRGTERVSDWFEIDVGSDAFYVSNQSEHSAGSARSSKDICGSRCLCVALERWVNKNFRVARAVAQANTEDSAGPRLTPAAPSQVRESPWRAAAKSAKAPAGDDLSPDDTSRMLEVFRKAVIR
jgi:hypothetical protein